ncbi:hypothetical protein EGJ57_21330 [Brucella anthropi]|nr:hypothetical protein EGJ57_21330 [Brucella anthropi]
MTTLNVMKLLFYWVIRGEGNMGNLVGVLLGLGSLGAWLTHVVTCFQEGLWGFLIAGAIFFPIGVVHGVMIWFGWA